MGLVEEPHREGQALWVGDWVSRVRERLKVTADLPDLFVLRGSSCAGLLCLEFEQLDDRGLGAFEL